jgi:hypothetical protein
MLMLMRLSFQGHNSGKESSRCYTLSQHSLQVLTREHNTMRQQQQRTRRSRG